MSLIDHDGVVFLHNISWDDYERLLEMRGDKSVPRISYLEGEVEMIRPSKDHEVLRSCIGRLVEDWCIERNLDLTPLGSWTIKDKLVQRGAEADECYIFGPRDRDRPHLVIFVELTDMTIDKLAIYEKARYRRSVVLA